MLRCIMWQREDFHLSHLVEEKTGKQCEFYCVLLVFLLSTCLNMLNVPIEKVFWAFGFMCYCSLIATETESVNVLSIFKMSLDPFAAYRRVYVIAVKHLFYCYNVLLL